MHLGSATIHPRLMPFLYRAKGTFKTPLFYIFKAYSTNCRGASVDTWVACDTFNTAAAKGIPYLDVTTVYDKATGLVYINVVNRHKDNAITADIFNNSGLFTGRAEASLVAGQGLRETFTYDDQENYKPILKQIDTKGNQLTYTFPPHSFTQIKVAVTRQ